MTAKDDLINFEKEMDAKAGALDILKLPIRSLYSVLAAKIFLLLHGDVSGNARPLAAYNLASRLSYITHLIASCPGEPGGCSALDALQGYDAVDADRSQINFLLAYAHFSEFMPEVHRDYYDVSQHENGFTLKHRSESFATGEAADILLSEVGLSFVEKPTNQKELLGNMVAQGLTINGVVLAGLRDLFEMYRLNVTEMSLMTDEAFIAATGYSRDHFSRFQAAFFALCHYAAAMAGYLMHRAEGEDEALTAEAMEWFAFCWRENPLFGILQGISGLSAQEFDALARFFVLNFRTGAPYIRHAGDGFFPPLILLTDAVLFSPDIVRMTLHSRNVLYALRKMEPNTFDRTVSQYLEPQLVAQALRILSKGKNLEIRTNVVWERGEIDLLLFDAAANTAMQIQVKATLPVQGARLVDRLEGRVREGLDQLRRFSTADPGQIDTVVSQTFGTKQHGVKLIDAVLTRSSVGTEVVANAPEDVLFLTLPVLALAAKSLLSSSEMMPLDNLYQLAQRYPDELQAKAGAKWCEREITLDGGTIALPMLDYDEKLVEAERQRAHEALKDFGVQ